MANNYPLVHMHGFLAPFALVQKRVLGELVRSYMVGFLKRCLV